MKGLQNFPCAQGVESKALSTPVSYAVAFRVGFHSERWLFSNPSPVDFHSAFG